MGRSPLQWRGEPTVRDRQFCHYPCVIRRPQTPYTLFGVCAHEPRLLDANRPTHEYQVNPMPKQGRGVQQIRVLAPVF